MKTRRRTLPVFRLLVGLWAGFAGVRANDNELRFESIRLTNGEPLITLHLLHNPTISGRKPVILMLGSLRSNEPPFWNTNLVRDGWLLAAFTANHPPDPDPARRPQWLVFDERFAHSYPSAAKRTIVDAQ